METDMDDTTEEKPVTPEKFPCTGCDFSYTVSVKGLIRKHNSRTGPGLCDGAQKPPREEDCACGGLDPDCPNDPENEREHCVPGDCNGCCGCSQECTTIPCGQPVTLEYAAGSPVTPEEAGLPTSQEEYDKREAAMAPVISSHEVAVTFCPAPDPFTAPAPVSDIPDGSVSQQPEPDRDRWGRYVVLGTAHTRATTFAKSCSDTFSLSEWGQRMVVRGLTLRPDLLALAHGLDVKQHRKDLNSIAEQAKEAAGQKVAANLGSAYHAFSERLDAGLMKLEEVPEAYRGRLAEYLSVMQGAGLTTRPEWIERTTAVRADQVGEPVAGTLDRIVRLPNGELVIADLKTGSDLSYGWGEIAVQLALYAHGVNTHGLFDWRTKSWDTVTMMGESSYGAVMVRTDYAIVMHLPADKEGCTLYRVDIEAGWEYARLCGHVRAFRKNKQLARPLELTDIAAPVAVAEAPRYRLEMERAISFLGDAASGSELVVVMGQAREARIFTDPELEELQTIASRRWEELATA